MTLDTYVFRIDMDGAPGPLAFALLAPAARFASLLWVGHARPVVAPDPLEVTAALDALLGEFQQPAKG